MAVVLALVTAVVYGASDFCGGLAAKRLRVMQVVIGSHLVGAVGSLIVAPILAETFTVRAVLLGALAGSSGVVGVALLYRRLAIGPMSVVAPLTALTSAVIPTAWGAIGGERLTTLGWIGVAIALAAVALVSMAPERGAESAPVTPAVVYESLLAGAGFGGLFIVLDATEAASAPWPIAGSRVFTSTVLLVVLLIAPKRIADHPIIPRHRHDLALVAAVGVLDTGANMTFLYATTVGDLAVVSVLAALYPISTVILARFLLAERMTRSQGIGFLLAMVATELLIIG